MEIKKKITVTTREIYELTTEDIEEIVKESLKLSGEVKFNWHIGQWASLNVEVTTREDKP